MRMINHREEGQGADITFFWDDEATGGGSALPSSHEDEVRKRPFGLCLHYHIKLPLVS